MKNEIKRLTAPLLGALTLVLALAFAACEQPTNGNPALGGTVAVTGTPRVGLPLTADISALEGEGEPAYQWQRAGSAEEDFTDIDGADGASYTPGPADEGKYIRVAVSRAGYSGTRTSPAVGPVTVPAITWTAVADGEAGVTTSTGITFTFSVAVEGLDAPDITLTNGSGEVTKGALSGGGQTWTLALDAVTTAGDVTVSVSKAGIESGPKNVAVYRQGETADITYEVMADGEAGVTTSTGITFTFSGAVEGLDAPDITLTNGSGEVTKGALSGSGTSWTLALTAVTTQGDLTVAVNKAGIESGTKSVTVHKAADITYEVMADGEAGVTTSTGISFTFSGAVTLTAADITLTNGSGEVTKGALSGGGQTWTLTLDAVTTAGDVTVSVSKAGIESGTKAVAVHKAPELTAEVVFGYTAANSSDINLTARAPAGIETANQNYYFSVMEKAAAYFTVTKTQAQTLTLGVTDAAKVTRTQNGTVDGSEAGPALEIFGVDTGGLTQYFGGERNFTLTVSEEGKLPKTVNIHLAAEVDLDDPGCTIFTVTYPGDVETLTRVDAKTVADPNVDVDNLVDALKWIDINAVGGTTDAYTEYLVRLEKDEAIPKIALICMDESSYHATDYVRIRLRGAVEERNIRYDKSTQLYVHPEAMVSKVGRGLINVGHEGYDDDQYSIYEPIIELQIENNVTLDGEHTEFEERGGFSLSAMVNVEKNCRFIMEEGSKITRYKAKSTSSVPVLLQPYSAFLMRGGEISDTQLYDNTGAIVNITPYIQWTDFGNKIPNDEMTMPVTFAKTGGVFRNNTFESTPQNYITWGTNAAYKIIVQENNAETEIAFSWVSEFLQLID